MRGLFVFSELCLVQIEMLVAAPAIASVITRVRVDDPIIEGGGVAISIEAE